MDPYSDYNLPDYKQKNSIKGKLDTQPILNKVDYKQFNRSIAKRVKEYISLKYY